MRIVMVGPFGLHPNKTMQSRALGLARPLVAAGHQVCLVMPPWQTPGEAGRRWQENGITISYISLGGGILGIGRRLLRETLAWNADVVYCFKPKAYSGFVATWIWLFYKRSLRLLVDTDDWEGDGGWNDRATYSPIQKRIFAHQESWGLGHNHYLTVASRTLQSLAWSEGVPRQQTIYIPNGPGIKDKFDNDLARRSQKWREERGIGDRPLLLLYSRLFEFDTERLINILRTMVRLIPDIAILLVGKSLFAEQGRTFQERLRQEGILPAVIDLGWVELNALPEILAAADVGLYLMDDNLINRAKCPVKLADMIAMGVPVVGEAVGQVPEYVQHGRSGFVVPSGALTEVTSALQTLLSNKHQQQDFSKAARRHYENHFRWPDLASRLESLFSP